MHAWGCGSCGQVCAHKCVHMGRVVGVCFVGAGGGGAGGHFSGVLASEQRPLESNPLSVESMGKTFLTEVKAPRLGPACHWAPRGPSGEVEGKVLGEERELEGWVTWGSSPRATRTLQSLHFGF